MTQPNTSTLDQLVALAAEADKILALGVTSHDIRNTCAVARGYLELARSYGEPIQVQDVERLLERMREALRESIPAALKFELPEWLTGESATPVEDTVENVPA